MKVEFIKEGIKNITIIDGISYTHKTLAKYIGLSHRTIHTAFWQKTPEEKILWIRKKLWLKEQRLPAKTALYTDGKEFFSLPQIQRATGLTTATASVRGRDWESGKITKKEMLRKKENCGPKEKRGKANWGKLKSVVRNCNLKGIPEPTKFDRVVVGQLTGSCLPAIANGNNHRKY